MEAEGFLRRRPPPRRNRAERCDGRDPALPPPRYAEHDQLYTPESLALLKPVVARALEIGEPYEVELEMTREDGLHHWIIARGEAIRDASGRVVRLQGTSQDITERRAQHEELRQAHDQAVAATQAKGDFLANMSHEIRTPMNGVIGMTDLLLDTQLNDLQRRYAETIRTSGEALITVINDVLDISKIEAGKLKIEAVDFDLRTVMEEVVDLVATMAEQKGLKIRCRVAPDVPGRLVGDPVRIRQVLTNLVGNAVKFTDLGTVDLGAELIADDGPFAKLRILVRDTGIGIPEDHQADIFDSFMQVEGGNSRSYGGTGLGLAICQKLTQLMGGRIGLESRPGFGSTFWFEVSLGRGQGEPDVSAEGLQGLRVLVVDDEETNRVILRETLRSWDCRPEVSASGVDALSRLLSNDGDEGFGLIFLDQEMPGMDGEQLARVIKAIPRHAGVPLVLLSSLSSPAGGVEFDPGLWAARLTKPIRRSQLY
ncbi:response regulator, partial [Singulisphaera rosea]